MILNFTKEQLADLKPIFEKYNESCFNLGAGSIIGQVYKDGMAIKILTYEQTRAIQEILMQKNKNHTSSSVKTRL